MQIRLIGVPAFSGSLHSGTETAPAAFRQAGLNNLLKKSNIEVCDLGDLSLPSYLPRHNIAPIRNWPSPRIIWDEVSNNSQELFNSKDFLLILGGDCSIITGTVHGLYSLYSDKLYVICIDAHLDALKPSSHTCVGAAAMGLWFLCNDNMFYNKPAEFNSSHISVLGTQESYEESYGISLFSLNDLRLKGITASVSNLLATIPSDSKILIHFDLDAITKEELPSVYAPSDNGFSLRETNELLSCIVKDTRTIAMEVTEFSAIKDENGVEAKKVAKLLNDVLVNLHSDKTVNFIP